MWEKWPKIIKNDNVVIYDLRRDDTNIHSVIFINSCGIMSVTGDLGNWIFNREFHPDGKILSADYMDEKLQIASVQKSKIYDSDETLKLLETFRNDFPDLYGRDLFKEELYWLEELENSVDDEFYYKNVAFYKRPISIDYETIPFGKRRHYWLEGIYDAFDYINKIIKNDK